MSTEQLAIGFMLLWMQSEAQRQETIQMVDRSIAQVNEATAVIDLLRRTVKEQDSLIYELKLNLKAGDRRWEAAKKLIDVLERRLAEKGKPRP